MKRSSRALRRQRHYGRMHRAGGLNLVSLMDIFTILVFFLMVNSSDVKVLKTNTDLPLPASSADQLAAESLTVEVKGKTILIDGREVAQFGVAKGEGTDGGAGLEGLEALAAALASRREQQGEIPDAGLPVTVLAGKDTEYKLLRQVLQTCVDQQFRQVRLAVKPLEVAAHG